jgi:hypothetical protein
MKKLFLVLVLVIMASAMALAQLPSQGVPTSSGTAGAVAPTVDVLGAHNNYGRGCAGCHAPHSGARGAGGGTEGAVVDAWSGANALFAQDMGPLFATAAGYFDFSDMKNTGSAGNYVFIPPSTQNPTSWNIQQYNDVRNIVMCLACHDGAVAKGAMMANWAYEEQIGALPTTYGTQKIPTLLGNDGSSAGYHNDHPVGENATLASALGSYYNDSGNGLVFVINATKGSITSATPAGKYLTFMQNYGDPAIGSARVNAAGVPYLVCTTCHNQHVMNIYAASANNPIRESSTGTYATYFFVNGPYNINNLTVPPTQAASTTQFCRQCHFGESNEANGGNLATSF